MKHLKKIICIFLSVLTVFGAAACGDTQGSGDDTAETPGIEETGDVETTSEEEIPELVLDIVKSGKSDFSIVYPKLSTEKVKGYATKLQSTIKEYTGATLEVHDDSKAGEYEILIGDTKRKESVDIYSELREKDGVLKLEGKKVVIAGGSEDYLSKAVSKLINIIYTKGKRGATDADLQLTSNDDVTVSYKYPTDASYSINGKHIKDYIIVYAKNSDIAHWCAYSLQSTILERVGYLLDIYSETENRSDCEILVGMTSRTEGSVADNSFSVKLQGDKLCLMFGDLVSQEQAIDYLNNYVFVDASEGFTADSNKTVTLSEVLTGAERSALGNEGDIRIIVNNIYQALDSYGERMRYLTQVYNHYKPDIICLQEAGSRSWTASSDSSVHVLMQAVGYETILAGGGQSNATPIIYNKATLELLESGYVQFTGANNSASKSFTWGRFKDKETQKEFICFSTHFMYNSGNIKNPDGSFKTPSDITASLWKDDSPLTYEATRVQNAKELKAAMQSLITEYQCPVFGGGDINSLYTSDAYKWMVSEEGGYTNVRDIAEVSDARYGTCRATCPINPDTGFFHEYLGEANIAGNKYTGEIDSIFALGDKTKYKVLKHDILIHDFSAMASDHLPVLADIELK